jgi:nicotinamidase-related amidase
VLLEASRSLLLVVDIQERLMPAIADRDRVEAQAGVLVASAVRLSVPILVTEQYPKGLGGTVDALAEALPGTAARLPKVTFSGAADGAIAAWAGERRAEARDQVVICGAEAHVCVLQTALGFHREGFAVSVVGDAVGSRSPHSVAAARTRLLAAGCGWLTTEMVLFEWLERAGTDDFRALMPLIKESPARSPPPPRRR